MKTVRKSKIIAFLMCAILIGCQDLNTDQNNTISRVLPILGFHDTELNVENNVDTIFHTIPSFYFTSHTGEAVNNETVKGHIYVADFFFTHCPSICPVMTNNLKDFHERTKDIEELIIISHTIDPERDSLERLNEYIELHEIDTRNNWFFVRGTQDYTYEIGKFGYLINADVDPAAEGGFLHSEHFVLVDRLGRIRGLYEGTDPEHVDKLEADIRKLLKTEYSNERNI